MMMSSNALQLNISEHRTILRLGDVLCVVLAAWLALRIWALIDGTSFQTRFVLNNLYWLPLLVGLWLILANINDFYDLRIASNLNRSLYHLAIITIQLLFFYLLIFFFSPRNSLPRLFILYYGVLLFLNIALWRLVLWILIARRLGIKRRVLIVGSGWPALTIIAVLRDEASDAYEIVGIVGDGPISELPADVAVLEPEADLAQFVREAGIAEVVLAYDDRHLPPAMFDDLMTSYEQGVAITPMPLLYEQLTKRVPIQTAIHGDWRLILPLETYSIFNPFLPVKRLLDIVFSLVGLGIFLVLLPLLALAIRLDSKGPIFYVQERLGKGGRPFKMFKLRTMVQDAEKHGPQWASQPDERITRVGLFLRKSRLDELPQFINILRGEMSLVGPRAERAHFVEELVQQIPFYRVRTVVRPGATGWAQVRFPYGRTVEDALVKLQYDLYYIRHQSLLLDIVIILRTLRTILSFSGS